VKKYRIGILGILVSFLASIDGYPQTAGSYDLVVYGGTAAGVTTAVSAAREGLRVVLLEPRDHIGGMVSGGLSRTDVGRREVIGGMALEFYWRAGRRYEMQRHLQDIAWLPEPKVAEAIFQEMIGEAGVEVRYRHRLREKTGVRKESLRIVEITMENGNRFQGKIFADCSYEGDLMAQAGVSYTWGREGVRTYGEELAGVREKTPYHQFTVDIPAKDENGKLLPEISPDPPGEIGSADRKVQAYNFRLILTDEPSNQTPFPKPPDYRPERYALLAKLLKAWTAKEGRALRLNDVTGPGMIPNRKGDFNNKGAFSTDYIGKNYDYPDGSYARREEIWRDHENYVKGFFYFLAHDPQVPPELQAEMNRWGLAKDEFTDNGNFPNQLYIREARRMVGDFVVTQKDLQTELTKPDPIGMGSYNSDSHNIQRVITPNGMVINEGDVEVGVKPYQIPYRVMLPKKSEVINLLVPVCFSASHVAYSSLRMEPQYMIIGQAAGVAAAMASKGNGAVQGIDASVLSARLQELGAIMQADVRGQLEVIANFSRRLKR
jgi:hypothetical protein